MSRVPVLIAGGGPAGMVAALLLHELGVETLVVERRDGSPGLPKAHILNQPSVEVLVDCGLGEELARRGSPHEYMASTAWYTSLAGPTPLHGRELGRLDAWGGGAQLAEHLEASPYTTTNLPQMVLEPLLLDRLRKARPDGILLEHEITTVHDEGDVVRAGVIDRRTGEEFTVEADYLIGSDGGRTVGAQLGIELSGQRDLVQMVTAHITIDLVGLLPDPSAAIIWFVDPERGGSRTAGCLVKMGGRGWGADADQWAFSLAKAVGDPVDVSPEFFVGQVRRAIGVPDLPVEVHRTSKWTIESVIADRFSAGRIHLIGDAAHRHPPTGGLGLNNGIIDAHNLAWKLALVHKGLAGQQLLQTYSQERRPVVIRNSDQSMASWHELGGIDEALGVTMDMTPDEGWRAIAELFEDTPAGRAKRVALDAAIWQKRNEFQAQNLQTGFSYEAGAVIGDGTELKHRPNDVTDFVVTSWPGHRLPHAWVEHEGERRSTLQLVRPGHFLLIVGTEGGPWRDAAAKLDSLDVTGVGPGQEWSDVDGTWLASREVSDSGAVLVRPDRHVAWRQAGAAADPVARLDEVMRTLLDH